MYIDYTFLYTKLQGCTECNIIVSPEYTCMVQEVYENISTHDDSINVFILSSDSIICPLKHEDCFSVILGVECPEHKFKKSVKIQEKSVVDMNIISQYKYVVYDSTYEYMSETGSENCMTGSESVTGSESKNCMTDGDMGVDIGKAVSVDKFNTHKNAHYDIEHNAMNTPITYRNTHYNNKLSTHHKNTHHKNIHHKNTHYNDTMLVVSKNSDFYSYWSRRYTCVSSHSLTSETRMDYLSRRITVAERARRNSTYAIIFVHDTYRSIALDIQDSLIRSGKCAYLLYLKNVHHSRLVTIENVSTLVLIDCPVFDNTSIDVVLPILTPADVQYLLSGVWDSTYSTNTFNVLVSSTDTSICKYEGAGKLLLENDFFGIRYEVSDDETEIHEGRKGIAREYE